MTGPVRTNISNKRVFIGLVITAVVVSLVWLRTDNSSNESRARADGGSVVEEFSTDERIQSDPFTARLLSGSSFESESLRGQVVVYNVWGSWCVPCAAEAPDLAEVANEFASEVKFVGINVRDNEAAARAFERDYSIPYDSIVASDSAGATLSFKGALTAAAVPTTLILDRSGRVAARAIGPVTAATLRSLLKPVLAEADSSANTTP